jgi:hypothetical protein
VSHLACDRISTRPSSFAKKSALRHGEARHTGGERIEDDHVDRLAAMVAPPCHRQRSTQAPPPGGRSRRQTTACWGRRAFLPCRRRHSAARAYEEVRDEGSSLGIARIRMRGQPASSRDRHRGRTGPSRGGAVGSGGDALRLVRATRDQLGVAWSVEADALSWRVVCWDSRDAAVARLKLSGTHRRATFAGLARLQQPFTIAGLRSWTRWLRALAGWACRSVSTSGSPCWARGSPPTT